MAKKKRLGKPKRTWKTIQSTEEAPLTDVEERVTDVYQLDVMSRVEMKIAQAIGRIPMAIIKIPNGELFRRCNPSPLDYGIRTAFWRIYDKHVYENRIDKIAAVEFCQGVCAPEYFFSSIASNPSKLLWIIRPKQAHHKEMETLLTRGVERLWEIIEIPIYDENRKVDPRMATIVLQAIKQIEDRVQGMAVQRKQSVSVNLNETAKSLPTKSMDAINDKIKELEQAISSNAAPGRRIIDHQDIPTEIKEPDLVELRPAEPGQADSYEHPAP